MNTVKQFNESSCIESINTLAQSFCQEILIHLPASYYTFPNPQYLDKWKHKTQHKKYTDFMQICDDAFYGKFGVDFCKINLTNSQQRVYWLGIELAKHKIRETDALEYDPFSSEKIREYSIFKLVFPEACERYDSNFNTSLEPEERNLHLADFCLRVQNKERAPFLSSAYPRLLHLYLLKTEPPVTELDLAAAIRSFAARNQISSSNLTKDYLIVIFSSIFNVEYFEWFLTSPRIIRLFEAANLLLKEASVA